MGHFLHSWGVGLFGGEVVTHSMTSKLIMLLFAVLMINQMACNARFQEVQPQSPQPSSASAKIEPNSGDPISCNCTTVKAAYCDPAVDGLSDSLPPLTFNPPPVRVTRNGEKCFINNYDNTTKPDITGVQVWLVVDSSRSFDEERRAVAVAMANSFITTLIKKVPVTVSVIAGHAPSSSWNGHRSFAPDVNNFEIFYRRASEPTSITFIPGMSMAQAQALGAQLLSKVDANMQESPLSLAKRDRGTIDGFHWELGDAHSGSDELGLRNFMAAMDLTIHPQNNAFVVLFLSDENDICTPFDERISDKLNVSHEIDGKTYYFSHRDEIEMIEDGFDDVGKNFCNGVSIDAAYSLAMNYANDNPLMIGALVYTGQSVPSGIQHTIGRGYMELVARAGRQGVMVDLAARNFSDLQSAANKLITRLAGITNESQNFHTQFPIYTSAEARVALGTVDVKPSGDLNIEVLVDGKPTGYDTDAKYSLIKPCDLGSSVEIRFCLK